MFKNLKELLYFNKIKLMFQKGIDNGDITLFDDLLYQKMSKTYIECIPVSMHIKYLKSKPSQPVRRYDRSLYMFLALDNALLVRADIKTLELKYGKEYAGHGWIEIGDYVYDPTSLLRFKKDVYYNMYCPTNVYKCTKEDYIKNNKKIYEDIKNTTLDDFKPKGKKRTDLCVVIPLLQSIVDITKDEEFKRDLTHYLSSIQYDEKQVFEEMYNMTNKIIRK